MKVIFYARYRWYSVRIVIVSVAKNLAGSLLVINFARDHFLLSALSLLQVQLARKLESKTAPVLGARYSLHNEWASALLAS